MSCPQDTTECVSGVMTCTALDTIRRKVYYKGCAAKKHTCEINSPEKPSCPSSFSRWSISDSNECCTGDKCNGGSSTKNSGPLRYTSVMLAVWVIALLC